MLRRAWIVVFAVLLLPLLAEPSRFGFSDRVERHMLPSVSTGPRDPAWSPDGSRIAFEMQGDIWTLPAAGGTATAVTQGPDYYYEPAWSPDGTRIACSRQTRKGELGIVVVTVSTGAVQPITAAPEIAVEPTWSRDGQSLFFAAARHPDATAPPGRRGPNNGFSIYRYDLSANTDALVGPGFEPAVSPDGSQLAYMAPVRGQLGTGGLWVRPLAGDGQPRLVRYEQTEYRMKPHWTPDGKDLLYVSDEAGTNDVRLESVNGGEPERLTDDDSGDEFSPAPSPDGARFAFISNRRGPSVLYTAPIGGGPFPSWQAVAIRARHARVPTGTVRIRVLDPQGAVTPARIMITASDQRGYAPDGGFARVIAVSGTHYFETLGSAAVTVPAGQTAIEAVKGFEYEPASVTVTTPADGVTTATIHLKRLANLPAQGWYSGDTHIHDLHQGEYGLSHQDFYNELLAEDMHVTNALIHMDGTRLMGRWADLTGRPSPLSKPGYILQYGEEFRGSLGHIILIGIHQFVLPLTAGVNGTAYAQPTLDDAYLDGAHAQGGISGYPHPYFTPPQTPQQAASTLIPVDAALHKGDFYDLASLWSDERGSTELYDRLLNCGFHIAATAGTDNFSDVNRDPPPGTDRTYVHVRGPLTLASWEAGIKAGHTFGSTAPLLTLSVNGREPGDEIQLAAGAPATLHVRATAVSIAPMTQLSIIVNGKIVQSVNAADPHRIQFEGGVPVPQGGWVAVRAEGPPSRYVADSYAFAQTTPVYVLRDGKQWVSAADANFLAQAVEATWTRVSRSPWRSDAERDLFHNRIEQAKAVYDRIAAESGGGQ